VTRVDQSGRPTLPVRPRPVAGEAAMSYVSRVADANGYSTLGTFRAVLASAGGGLPFDRFCRLLELTDTEVASLHGPMPEAWSAIRAPYGLDVSHFNHCWIRWCPQCVARQAIIRWEWTLKTATACVVHGVSLRDTCHVCGDARRWGLTRLERCECGARLAGQPAKTAAAMVVDVNRLAAGFGTVAPLPSVSPSAWFRAIVFLVQAVGSAGVRRSGKVPGLNRLHDAEVFVVATASLFDDWPRAFDALLRRLLSVNAGSASIQRTFDPLYRILYQVLRSTDFDFMREAFEVFLHEHWWGLICRRNRRLGDRTVQGHPRVTASQAAAMAGISPSALSHMVQSDLLSSESASFRSGKRARTLHVDEVRVAAGAARGACTLAEAAMALALPESRVRQLIDAGTISTLISRRTCPTAAKWLIPAKELKKFDTFSAADSGRDVVTLRTFLRYERMEGGEVGIFVAQVMRGALRAPGCAVRSAPLGEVLLDRAEARAWLAGQRNAAHMSIDEAGKRLGMKQQVAYALAKEGLLTTDVDANGRRRVTPDGLVSFVELYVSLAAIARSLGTSPKSALRRIRARPVCGPGIDANRQYFYRRAEISNELEPRVLRKC